MRLGSVEGRNHGDIERKNFGNARTETSNASGARVGTIGVRVTTFVYK